MGTSPDYARQPWRNAVLGGLVCGAAVGLCTYIQTRSVFFAIAGGVVTFPFIARIAAQGRGASPRVPVDRKLVVRALIPASLGLIVAAVFRSWFVLAIALANAAFWLVVLVRSSDRT